MSASTADPRVTISSGGMSLLQIVVVIITLGLTALDGFDVLSSSFANPGISKEWGINKEVQGWFLLMDLIGMAFGSILLGGVADKIGRRPTTLGCLVVMVIGMFMVTQSHSVAEIMAWRVLTGLGIGGLLAATNAVVAEFSSSRWRNLCVAIMAIGYPLGGVLGGSVVAHLLEQGGWRSVFYFGSAVTAVFLPIVLFVVPESVHWLTQKQPAKALERVNRALKRMGRPAVQALPAISTELRRRSIGDIFSPALVATTLLCAVAYFFHVLTFYFVVKWIPTFVTDMGFTAADGARVLVRTNIGGAIGGAVLGLLALRFRVKWLTILVMILSMAAVTVFGRAPKDLQQLALFGACAGFCTNAAIVGMYAIFAHAFPTHVRAVGTGFSIGVGRGGAVLAPAISGHLLFKGYPVATVAMIMSASALIAAFTLMFLKLQPEERVATSGARPLPSASA